ncbi:MAG: hypothetical protein AB1426_04110 [Bacillota bacterium]
MERNAARSKQYKEGEAGRTGAYIEIREDSDSEPDAVMRSSLPRLAKERLFSEEVVKMAQISISEMEKLLIRDSLNVEQVRVKKLAGYTEMARDPALKGLLNQMHQMSQQHVNALNNLLGQAGIPQTPTAYF